MYFYVHYTGCLEIIVNRLAREPGVGDWLANVPRRTHRHKPS